MRRFRFRLERLLELRRHHVERRRRELASAGALQHAAEGRERAWAEHTRVRQDEIRDRLAAGLDAGVLGVRLAGLEAARGHAERLARESRAAREQTQRARGRLVEAQRDARVLERLRRRAWALHRLESERREQRELDEAGTQAWGRRGDRI